MHGGDRIGSVLHALGVPFVFTLCGGHISPILVGCKRRGIRVVDVRHESTALFAADAVARLSGRPGVAVITAGPGVSNLITALKNAQLAQSPVVVLGGATATRLRGRGALQDIDQLELVGPHVKWKASASRVREIGPLIQRAFTVACSGVPGPVFVELPVDLLYPEEVVRDWYRSNTQGARSLSGRLLGAYLTRHLDKIFAGAEIPPGTDSATIALPSPTASGIRRAARRLRNAEHPVLIVGSQAMLSPLDVGALADAVSSLGVPVFLSGMARGLLGANHPLQIRHQRKHALKEADLILLAGLPCDFRLGYGGHIPRKAFLIGANRSRRDLKLNRRPDLGLLCDAGLFLRSLAGSFDEDPDRWRSWQDQLRRRDAERDQEIQRQSEAVTDGLNPLRVCREIEAQVDDESVLVADGGDFVATASYVVRPRAPLSWLDPGAFGTLGVGAGFALGAKLCRPESEVWLLYGDGAAGYSLAEFDTFVRHRIAILAVVGNDACWMQIARGQVDLLGDDVGCPLLPTNYHHVAEGFGAEGILLNDTGGIGEALRRAKRAVREGRPVLVNALIGKTDFRKGSISI